MSFEIILPFLRPIARFIEDPDVSEIMVNPGGREVTVGASVGDDTEVLSGLKVGETIATTGSFTLKSQAAERLPFSQALRMASIGRVRPKLMTAGCAMLGLLALVLARTQGCKLERPLAIVMIGGWNPHRRRIVLYLSEHLRKLFLSTNGIPVNRSRNIAAQFACAASLVGCLVALSAQSTSRPLLIRNVRVFDGERVFEGRDVWIENGVIARVLDGAESTASAEIVDGRGRTLLPGLIDAHVHVPAVPDEALRQFADLGVTTVLDMFGGGRKLASKQRIVAAHLPGLADLRVAGFGATAPGSMLGKMALQPIPSIDRPEQAQAWVDARIAEGSDYIKIIDDEPEGGRLDRETIEAIVQATHRRGKLAVAHVLSEQKAREAITAGVDGLAHLFIGEAVSRDFGQLVASHHAFVVPTLTILRTLCGESDGRALLDDPRLAPFIPADQRPALTRAPSSERQYLCKGTNDALHQLVAAHVPILAGTDTMPPEQVGAFAVTGYGATLHAELKLLVDQGMTAAEALTAATAAPARAFRLTDRGHVREGMRADLLLVEGNPTQDILATRNIVDVWTRGVRVDRRR